MYTPRGSEFRKEFSHLGEIRSLMPNKTHVMAITATATLSSRRIICQVLGMEEVALVSEVPNRPNIEYSLKSEDQPIEVVFAPLVEELRCNRCAMDRVIVFCRNLDGAAFLYAYFQSRLQKESLEPISAPDLNRYRLFDLFTSCTPDRSKKIIIEQFCKPGSQLRVVIATIAFGMGLNCPDIRSIIHWGPPMDLESYIQETGRAGRDGLPSTALLYVRPHDLRSPNIEPAMKNYCKNKSVFRRQLLLKQE